jgi:hypothetical protein
MGAALLIAVGILGGGVVLYAVTDFALRRYARLAAAGDQIVAPVSRPMPPKIRAAQEDLERIPTPDPERTAIVRALTKTEAEELLDWLEANGYENSEVAHRPDEGFEVRFRMGRRRAVR